MKIMYLESLIYRVIKKIIAWLYQISNVYDLAYQLQSEHNRVFKELDPVKITEHNIKNI